MHQYYITKKETAYGLPLPKMLRWSTIYETPKEIEGVGTVYGVMEFNSELSKKAMEELGMTEKEGE